jgi:hypothetical protein
VSDDPEYDDMERAERKTKRFFKKQNYRHVEVACCETCKYADFGYEGEINCGAINTEPWAFNSVSSLCICDNYKLASSASAGEGV